MKLRNLYKKHSSVDRPAPLHQPAVLEIPLGIRLPNDWAAEKALTVEGSSVATVVFRHNENKQTCVADLNLCAKQGSVARFLDIAVPALLDKKGWQPLKDIRICFIEADISGAIDMYQFKRISSANVLKPR